MITRIRPFLNREKLSKSVLNPLAGDVKTIAVFEKMFAAYLGGGPAVAVNQGRSALLLALKILGLKNGDEVIVQSHIFHVVIDAILETGARPVLVDSNLHDFNISADEIKKEVTPHTKAIIAAHLGIPCDIEKIAAIARENNCFLIENCAHTLGGKVNGKNAGTFGDLSFFSFDVDKPFTTGDGGMLVINNKSLMDKAQQIISQYNRVTPEKEKELIYGLFLHHFVTSEAVYPPDGFLPVDFGKTVVKKDHGLLLLVEKAVKSGADGSFHEIVLPYLLKRNMLHFKASKAPSIVSRIYGRAIVTFRKVTIPKIDSDELLMNSLRSAVGIECLKDYDAARNIRNENAQYYADHLDKKAFEQPEIGNGKTPAFIRYSVLNNTKYENSHIRAMAKEKGFEIGIFNWSAPIHSYYPYNKILSFERNKLLNSEDLGRRLLSLPVHPYVDKKTLNKIVQLLNKMARR